MIDILLLVPAVCNVILVVVLAIGLAGLWPSGSPSTFFPILQVLIGILFSWVLFVITIIHLFTQTFKLNHWFLHIVGRFYKKHYHSIIFSVVTSISNFVLFSGFITFPNFFQKYFATAPTFLFITIISSLITYGIIRFVKVTKFSAVTAIVILLSLTVFVGYLIYGLTEELRPHHFFTFPLNDSKSRYILNYDGDYWLTQYKVNKKCTAENVCSESLEKIGNTSIAESPVDLMPYVEKPVRVTGDFVRIRGPQPPENKQFCISEGFNKKCRKSTGPGTWYASPLIIKSIELE